MEDYIFRANEDKKYKAIFRVRMAQNFYGINIME